MQWPVPWLRVNMIPNRLGDLVDQLEKRESISQADLARVQTLQSLDVAQLNRQFVEDFQSTQEQRDVEFANTVRSILDQ